MLGLSVVAGTFHASTYPDGVTADTPRNDREAVEELKQSYPELDEWRSRTRSPLTPSSGSALAQDDAVWPRAPLSAIIGTKLAAAVDHLQAFRVLSEARSYHPVATYTLTRSALLAASEALWMLGPEHGPLRQSRGLWVARDADEEHLKYLRTIRDGPGVRWRSLADVHLHLVVRRHAAGLYRASLPKPGATGGLDVIKWAAEYLQPHSAEWVAQACGQWRAGSGNAHGFQYAAIAGLDLHPEPEPVSGLDVFGAGGSPLKAWQNYYVPAKTLRRAWQRWDELAEPTP